MSQNIQNHGLQSLVYWVLTHINEIIRLYQILSKKKKRDSHTKVVLNWMNGEKFSGEVTL